MGIADAPPEPRLQTLQITDSNQTTVQAVLDRADAIIACLATAPSGS